MLNLQRILELARAHGARQPALCRLHLSQPVDLTPDGLSCLIYQTADDSVVGALHAAGWRTAPITHVPPEIDSLVVIDAQDYGAVMRAAEPLSRRGLLTIPASPDALVDSALRTFGPMESAWQTSADANYVARCALRGHYVEFGTWYGRSFITNYYRYRHWLQGQFYAFDSFAGLSAPLSQETAFTGGDFTEGAYCCNLPSFEANLALADVPKERIRLIPGFYSETLKRPAPDYGLEPGSVSVCVIDCDLREPTEQVLRFVTPLLEQGALIYFDDWRLARGSSVVGERAAALTWLASNPEIELIEFSRDFWQHQWFIYQRRG